MNVFDKLVDLIITADMWIVVISSFLALSLTLSFDAVIEENKMKKSERNEQK